MANPLRPLRELVEARRAQLDRMSDMRGWPDGVIKLAGEALEMLDRLIRRHSEDLAKT